MTFGAWALLVGEVGFSVATVASISLGIIVDDTVHWLSKYVRARDERLLSVEESIRYAFHNVGMPIVVNTVILAAGFFVMTTSAFKMNVDLGLMTILSIVGALILDSTSCSCRPCSCSAAARSNPKWPAKPLYCRPRPEPDQIKERDQ